MTAVYMCACVWYVCVCMCLWYWIENHSKVSKTSPFTFLKCINRNSNKYQLMVSRKYARLREHGGF